MTKTREKVKASSSETTNRQQLKVTLNQVKSTTFNDEPRRHDGPNDVSRELLDNSPTEADRQEEMVPQSNEF